MLPTHCWIFQKIERLLNENFLKYSWTRQWVRTETYGNLCIVHTELPVRTVNPCHHYPGPLGSPNLLKRAKHLKILEFSPLCHALSPIVGNCHIMSHQTIRSNLQINKKRADQSNVTHNWWRIFKCPKIDIKLVITFCIDRLLIA